MSWGMEVGVSAGWDDEGGLQCPEERRWDSSQNAVGSLMGLNRAGKGVGVSALWGDGHGGSPL